MDKRYRALACDYDGTLATDGVIPPLVLESLDRLRRSGFKLILVTGRELLDLLRIFPGISIFDRVVAENGAVLYRPDTREEVCLAPAPPAKFLDALKARGVEPLSRGLVIVATQTPHEKTVLDIIRDLGLEMTLAFNKGSVMILPSGFNKAKGLLAALSEVQVKAEDVVGIGDAENDHAFLEACGYAAAVANALPAVKEHVQFITTKPEGEGVRELIEKLLI